MLTIVTIAGAWWLISPLARTTEGPLDTPGIDGTSFTMEVGGTGSWGRTILINRGTEDAVIDDVRALDVPEGLEVVQTLIAGPKRKMLFQASTRVWPDPDITDLGSPRGARVAPLDTKAGERGAEIVLVLRPRRPGRYVISRIEVTYRVGRHKHRRIVRGVLALCATTLDWRKAPYCELPKDLPT